jgi:acetolactate decarboxylase
VPAWRTIPIPPEVRSFTDLEAFVPRAAATVGLDPQRPVPLLVHGREDVIEFHILNRVGDGPYNSAKLKEIQAPFDLTRTDAIIVGFYSPSHRGIFTNMDSSIHIHFQTTNNDASGHIYALEIGHWRHAQLASEWLTRRAYRCDPPGLGQWGLSPAFPGTLA